MNQYLKEVFYLVPFVLFTGTGALFLTLYLVYSKNKNNYVKLFIIFTIAFSLFEYLVGFALDALFAERWWDYSDEQFNINGRITILNSFLWGVITIVFARFIYPLITKFKEKLLDQIPIDTQIITAIILISAICIDFVLSCVRYLIW